MNNLVQIGYLAAGVLFILSLGGLSTQESAKRRQLLRYSRDGHRDGHVTFYQKVGQAD